MFIGHYGAAYAIKRWRPDISIFTLFMAVQLLDVAWAVLVFAGVEKVRIVPDITETNSLDLYYMPYTHSLLAAVVWAMASGVTYKALHRAALGAGIAIGLAVFSHWAFDFLVHRPDLPLYDNVKKVGLGWWNFPRFALLLEVGILLGGLVLYLRGTRGVGVLGSIGPWLFVIVLIAVQASVFFGRSISSPNQAAVIALVSYVVFALIAVWLDHHRRVLGNVTPGRPAPVLRGSGAAAAHRP
ncbi:MAG TPA: hypothetical protein VFV99_25000 [Kofleriaceae bacterium]|nr:hypothetical protein [Kofleriaceae bacterium]